MINKLPCTRVESQLMLNYRHDWIKFSDSVIIVIIALSVRTIEKLSQNEHCNFSTEEELSHVRNKEKF